MSKQLLIYETAVPVQSDRHSNLSVEGTSYAFSAGVNAVPLMAPEFDPASGEYAIVFTGTGDEIMPVAILGVKNDQNLFLDDNGQWSAKYIPAFIRRYPFVFSSNPDGQTLTLCIDEAFSGCNRDGRGQRLFTDERKPTPYVEQVLKFLESYQAHFMRTRNFGKKLKDLELLETMQAQINLPDGGKMSLVGFMAVNREKLRKMSPESLAALAATDELELVYLHLHSMRNFEGVKDRLIGSMKGGK